MSVRTLVKSIQDIMRQDTGVDGDAQRISQLCWMFFLKIIDDQDQELELMKPDYRSPIPERFQWRAWAADPEGITGEALLAFINDELFPALKNLQVTGQPGDRRRVVRDVFEDAYNYMKSGQLMRQVVNKLNGIDFNDLSQRQHLGDIYEQILNDLQSAGNAGEYYTPRAVTAFMVDRIDPKPGETLFDPACGTGGFLTCAIGHMRERYVKRPEDEQALQASLRAVEKKQLPHMLCITNMLLHGIEDPSFVRHDNTLAWPYIGWEQKDRVDIVLTNPPFGGREEDGIESNFPPHFRTRETADLFLALIIRLLKPGGRAAVVLPDGSLFGEGVKTRLKEHLMEECNLHTIVRLPNSVFRPYASIGTNLLFFEKGEPTREIWFYEHRVSEGQKAYSMTRPIRLEHLQPCIDWWGEAGRKGREETEFAWKVTAEEVKARGYNLDIKNPHTVEDDHGEPEELLAELARAEAETAALRNQLKAILAEALLAMNADQMLSHFEKIAEAPEAIPRLRRFILELAVRGKLVPQDPNDESAAELLKRIMAEKARLVRSGEIRKPKPTEPIRKSELPIKVPQHWAWLRLREIGVLSGGMTPSKHRPDFWDGDVVWLSPKDIKADELLDSELKITEKGLRETRLEIYHPGCLFMVARSGILKRLFPVAINRVPATANQDMKVLVPFLDGQERYLQVMFRGLTDFILEQLVKTGTTVQSLKYAEFEEQPFPLPPLAEQHRIVAKVDELMALCDRLEASLNQSTATRRCLLDALLHATLSPETGKREAA